MSRYPALELRLAGVLDVASAEISRGVGWLALLLAVVACGSRSSLAELRGRELDAGGASSAGGMPVATAGGAASGAGSTGLAGTNHGGSPPATSGGAATGGAGVAGNAGNGGAMTACEPNPCQNGGSCVTSSEATTCVCLAAFTGDTCELPRFERLGSLPGFQESYAQAISGDGQVIVGYVPQGRPDEREAFRWTKASGMKGLGYLPGSSYGSAAWATSADGSIVAGDAAHHDCQGCGGTQRAIRWQASSGIKDLPFLADHHYGFANGISGDGSVVVGFSYVSPSSEMHWIRWTEQAGPEDLGDGYATGISADGHTIVGAAYDDGHAQAMRWTEQDGRIMLGGVDAYWTSIATAASSDGSVVVGWSIASSGSRAFRWQKSTGAVGLGTLPGDGYSVASSVSADGAIVVGDSAAMTPAPPSSTRAVRWDETQGVSAIETLLTASNVDLSGWQLLHASGVSMNGKVVTGWGTNPSGAVESWIARLP
jgi:probable HAF family extracellular repeat protein